MAGEDSFRDYLKLVTTNRRQARRRLRDIEERSREPIAIVGIGCRFPGGAASPQELWQLLERGADVISDFPADRGWDIGGLYDPDPGHPGTTYSVGGGFIYDVPEFDAGFFGISPREALAMDPQQRLLLETCWEALERAGINPASLRGSRTGVFAGAFSSGYGSGLPADAEGHLLTGTFTSVLSGRIAFTLGFEGPAVTVDTESSSSLVALHLACQSLRCGECTMVLAGGVTVIVNPAVFVGFSRQRGMSVDGRCKAFSSAADGMGLAEGAGMLVLERLSDARRHGHQVLAVIRGSAVNQDGASNGLTAPSGPSQQRVIRAALENAGLSAGDVDVVEAHGTGTKLGDPIEAHALLATYGRHRPEGRPLWLGSVKSNIGHAQAAAGVAGVIKMVLALQHRTLPPTLHADERSRYIDWSSGDVSLLTEARPWTVDGRPRRAGVSAFGLSGTNAHLILEEPPAPGPGDAAEPKLPLLTSEDVAWPVSGRSAEALAAQASRLAGHVAGRPDLDPVDVGWSLAAGRPVFEHRAVVIGAGGQELAAGLDSLAAGEPADGGVVAGSVPAGGAGRVVFVFPGQGAQWAGMGRELAACCPVFAARLAECGRALAPYVDWSLEDVIAGAPDAPGLAAAEVVQPVLWAVMVSLAAVWEAAGIIPDAVVGHSLGEIAAACVAGMLSLEDAAQVAAIRSQALSALGAQGGMISVVMPAAAVRELLGPWHGRLLVAAVNGPAAVVVSGDLEALDEFEAELSARRVLRWRIPQTDFVAHSAMVEELEEGLLAGLAGIRPGPGRARLFSTAECRWMDGAELDAAYWYASERKTVQFAEAVRGLAEAGHRVFIEVSPHPVLTTGTAECLEEAGVTRVVTGTLDRERAGARRVLTSLARAHVAGATVNWTAVFGRGRHVDLPTYPFQRQRYWPEAAPPTGRQQERDRSAIRGWRYRVTWVPVTQPSAPALPGTWLLLTPAGAGGDQARACAQALTARRAKITIAPVPAGQADRAALADLIARELAKADLAGVLSLLALDEAALADHPAVPRGLAGTQALIQALGDAEVTAPLWVLTQGAVGAVPGEILASPVQAQAWGLGRVAALEHPDRWGGLIDLPPVLDEPAGARLCALLGGRGEDQAAIRAAGIFGRRLERAPAAGATGSWVPRGTVLVTGGTGAIAGHVARWLASRGAERLMLASRSGPMADDLPGLAAGLAAAGAEVTVVACDVARREEAGGLLSRIASAGPPLSAVMHAAGMFRTAPLAETRVADLAAVLSAKAAGAANLDELTAGMDLDAFVLFSSVAATWGSGTQAAYAAANTFLDALAENRRGHGLAAASVAWGLWDGSRMGAGDGGAHIQRHGIRPMEPALAIRALAQVLDGGEDQVTVADVDWATFTPPFTLRRPSPLIESLPEARQALPETTVSGAAGAAAQETQTALARQLRPLPRTERDSLLTGLIRDVAAGVLGHPSPDAVEPGRAFSEMGFDSLAVVRLRTRLGDVTGLRLPMTLLFDYPTPAATAGYLRARLVGESGDVPGSGVTATVAAPGEPVAIVAMGCRFPGGARSPEELWGLLSAGRDAVSVFPADRGWNMAELYDPDPDRTGSTYVRAGGFLYEAADFDAGFFGISPREALAMDPQQRLLLEISWEALERAGIDPGSLRGSATGVFVGSAPSGYGFGEGLPSELEGHLTTGTGPSVMSGRVSYLLGLEGPAVTVDTACSSSLIALHLACQALRSGDCTLALAGGITVMSSPAWFVWMSRQRGLAADGRCKSFSSAADGMGIAEGAGVVVLERLPDARRLGHRVLAVVRGTALNQDGASNGLTAPNGLSQERVIRAALANAGLGPEDVDAVEAHGSGTVLGDPIEAHALLATYGQSRPEDRPLWLGSVKSNIGHTQWAAGAAGLIKMILALQHGVLPRTLHVDEPSQHIDWSAGVRLLTEQVPWLSNGRPRRAGVSSFGMSGTNAHAIIEEPPAGDSPAAAEGAVPLVPGALPWQLSARSAEGLRAQAGRLAAHAAANPELDPADVSWSLATTRSAFEHRAVVIGAGAADLAAKLAGFAAGEPGDVMAGSVPAGGAGRVVFVFPGQGSQWEGMGRELAAVSPVFAARLAECGRALAPYVDWSLEDVIAGTPGAPGLAAAEVVQPVLWAVMVSLAAVWEAAGVVPDAVVGHSQGEIAAARVAGILTLEDAARLIAVRSKALSGFGAEGGMISVVMPAAAVRELIQPWDGRLSIAAVNGPAAVVVSGDLAALGEFEADLSARHVMRWRIPETGFVAHSSRVEEFAGSLVADLAFVRPRPGRARLFSTVECRWMDGAELDAAYWYANVRKTVRFSEAVQELAGSGHRVFVEVSPHPVLEAAIADTIEESGATFIPVISGTTHRESHGAAQIILALSRLHVRGVPVDWAKVLGGGRRVELPTYAFQRQRYWPDGAAPAIGASVPGRRRERDRSQVESWLYRVSWEPVTEPGTAALAGTWLVLAPAEAGAGLADDCVRAMSARGARVVVARADASVTGRAELASLVTRAVAGAAGEAGGDGTAQPAAGVVSLLALDESGVAGHPSVPEGMAATLALVQALGDADIDSPLWVLTSGAVAVAPGEALPSPVQASVWGLVRCAALEYPGLWGGLVDLPPELDGRAGARLCTVLAGLRGDQVAIRDAGIMVRRLERAPGPGDEGSWRPRGTVLITGGTGALGAHTARWLAGRGAERVVLTSRSGALAGGAAALAASLAEAGAAVGVAACDVSDRDAVAGLITWTGLGLSAVVHAAGVIDDGVVGSLDTARLETALSAKAGGAAHLDELTAGLDLDAFVLFSSAASTFGGAGQGNYAAANAYLDALAQSRRAHGLAGVSVAWGAWAGGGVAQASEAVRQRLSRSPYSEMDPAVAVRVLGHAVTGPDALLAAMDVDWAVFTGTPGLAGMPFIRNLPEVRKLTAAASPAGAAAAMADDGLARRLTGLPRAEQDRVLIEVIQGEAAGVLGHDRASAVDVGRPFGDLGFDSLTALEMRQRMSAVTGLRLPAALLFDYPTPEELASHLRTELVGDAGAQEAVMPAAVTAAAADEPVAIVAMSCRYPGGVRDPEGLWDLIMAQTDAISGLPRDRGWKAAGLGEHDPGSSGRYLRSGGFVHEAADFDPGFFSISPREAMAMDPQQRLLLETCWEALERAGIDPRSLRGSRTGVFVGGYTSGYLMELRLASESANGLESQDLEGHLNSGNATSVLSGRVSYTLGLEGPAATMDTACSSSLVAIHIASQALRSGECSLALVGGVTIMAAPGLFGFSYERQQGLAADGRCKAFSSAADGMGLAEGAGMLVLERLSDARRHGHQVLAVIRGSAVNQDGASNGLTAPSGPSQQRVIRAALENAGLSAGDVDVVEAHGTGTKLGDPIEAHALLATYGRHRPEGRPLWLGSVKSNIGHAQAAAGVAGVIKMVLALQHRTLPPTLHADERSRYIDWSSGDVSLLTEARPWTVDGRPRRAGVSAFGLSGTNAHLILEEPPAPGPGDAAEPKLPLLTSEDVAWPVSGRSAEALAAQASRLAGHVAGRPDLDPVDVGWSLAAGRPVFEHRAVVIGAGGQELAAGLDSLAAGEPADGGVVAGSVPAGGAGRVVFVFPGQGAQWAGMGRELAACCPVFAARLAECGRALAPYVDWSLEDVIAGAPDAPGLAAAEVVQPVLWAVMVSLAAVWEAAGIIPDAVVGHSLGEIAAACVAGMLSLEDAAQVAAIRSQALSALGAQGGMISVVMPAAAVRELLGPWHGRLLVAAVNGPAAVVVSGDLEALDEFEAELSARRVLRWRIPQTDFVAHSAMVEELEEGLLAGLAGIRPGPGRARLFSTAECRWMDGAELDAAYWYANVRKTVQFAEAVRGLAEAGHRVFIEVSPHPVLTTGTAECLEEAGVTRVVTGTLDRERAGARRVLTSLARAHVAGATVNWTAVFGRGRHVDLPTYPFQRQRYWPQAAVTAVAGDGAVRPAEAKFWAVVEGGDVTQLARTLAVRDEQGLSELLSALSAWRRQERDRLATGSLRYRVFWAPVTEPATARLSGTWLVITPPEPHEDGVARALAGHGADVVPVTVTTAGPDRAALADLIGRALPEADLAGVVSLLALDETPLPDHPAVPAGLAGTQALIQALGDAGIAAPLWVLTRGAVAASPGEKLAGPVQAQAWGLGRVAALEHPDRWGGLIDLQPALDERAATRLCGVLAGCGEDQVAVRAAGVFGRRLERAPQPGVAPEWVPGGTVLLTGGTGVIAGHAARWLAGRGARRVVLASRSGPAAATAAGLAAELAAAGTAVDVLVSDIARRDEVAGLLDRINASGPPLTAVLHAAGLVQLTRLEKTDTAELASVLEAKAGGAAHLDELTAGMNLEAFVLFSSIAATWGSGQQPAYSAANTYLDALAQNRRARGLPATSAAWGPWGGGGMSDDESVAHLRRRGLRVKKPELAVRALAQVIDGGETLITIADVDWAAFAPPFTLRRPSPLIENLPEVRQVLADAAAGDAEPEDSDAAAEFAGRLAQLPPDDQERLLTELVRSEAAPVLGHSSAEAVEAGRAFSELGFDSITVVELRNRLGAVTGLRLPATLLFDYPTPATLARYLRSAIAKDEGSASPVLAEIDKLESMLSTVPAADAEYARITARLETVMSKWIENREHLDGITASEKLEASSDDEVFDFIGKELGIF